MWSGSQITCFSMLFLLHFGGRGLVLFKVTSEDAFVVKELISPRIYLYICILSFTFFLTKWKSRESNNHWQYIFLCSQKGDSLFKLTIKKKKEPRFAKLLPSLLSYLLEVVWKMGISKTGEPGSGTAFKSTKKLQTLKNMHFNLCILVSTLQRQLASNQWVENGEKQFNLKSRGSSTGGWEEGSTGKTAPRLSIWKQDQSWWFSGAWLVFLPSSLWF